MTADAASNPIVLYDGVCGLCNRVVRFVLKRDQRLRFRFAALQSDFASPLLRRHGADPDDLDTMYVLLDSGLPTERLVSRGDAATVILKELGGVWGVLGSALGCIPRGLRNWGYNLVARNRYRIFGKYDVCPLADEKDRGRFLDLS